MGIRSITALLCTVTFLYSAVVRGQSVEQWSAWGDAATARGEHYGASRFYAGALELEPGRMGLQWKQAEACRLSNQYPQAAALYERVAQKDMGRTYPEALRWLGEMQLCEGNYTDAQRTWNKVLQKEKDKTSAVALRAKNAVEGCVLAARSDSATDPTTLEHLPQPINTFDSEFGARFGPDSALWFSSLRGELNADEEVQDTASYHVGSYVTHRNGPGWEDPMKEDGPADAMGAEQANLVWSSNGERMFFTQVSLDGTRSIHTRLTNGPGEPVQGLGVGHVSTQPWIARMDGTEVMLFASDRPDGVGGMDIWIGDLVGTGVVNVRNAGPLVNSPGNESSPSYDESNGTLWFSSDFLPGLGGYDIFQSTWKNGAFTMPVNAQKPINSPANDLYPVFNAVTGEGWLTSNRKGSFAAKGETCCNDLYRFNTTKTIDNPVVLVPNDTFTSIGTSPERALLQLQAEFPLKLYFHNDEPEPRSWATTTGQTYAETFTKYKVLFPTYREENTDPTRINGFFNDEVERGREKLDALVEALIPLLDVGQRVTLDVRGHASPLAKNDYNRNLSLRRIESLRKHLLQVENGRLRAYLDSTAINGGLLRINVLPFGEDRSAGGVSDDLKDLKHSVYSVEAARERRIEVERVGVEPNSTGGTGGDRSFDIGTLHQSEQRAFLVPFKNKGTSTLRILKARTSCDCVQVQTLPGPIAPGGSGSIELLYTGRARPGPLVRTLTLDTDGTPSQIELTIHGTVIEEPMELLLLSNSTLPGEPFFQWPRPFITPFLAGRKRVGFVPFATPEDQQDGYVERMATLLGEMGCETIGLHRQSDAVKTLGTVDLVMIGGGNSFLLLRSLYRTGLLKAIGDHVKNGMPYLGWSAGANVACPTIMTTNDMPIVEPPSLKALNLVPFQINPHYTEATIPGHGGESRGQRIAEFLALNARATVVGLREGSLLHVKNNSVQLHGKDMVLFRAGKEALNVSDGTVCRTDLSDL